MFELILFRGGGGYTIFVDEFGASAVGKADAHTQTYTVT